MRKFIEDCSFSCDDYLNCHPMRQRPGGRSSCCRENKVFPVFAVVIGIRFLDRIEGRSGNYENCNEHCRS